MQLERVFERQKYLGSRDRQRLAEQLQMSETQVNKLFLGVGWAFCFGFWILLVYFRFQILDSSGDFGLWTLVADFRF